MPKGKLKAGKGKAHLFSRQVASQLRDFAVFSTQAILDGGIFVSCSSRLAASIVFKGTMWRYRRAPKQTANCSSSS